MEFEEQKKKLDELKVLAQNHEPRLRYYERRAQNVAMAYLLWERFFVFGMSQTSSSLNPKCTHWWMVLGFSLSSISLYILFFFEAVIMLYRAQNSLDMIWKRQIEICQHISAAGNPDDVVLQMEAGDSISSAGLDSSFHVRLLEYNPYRIVPMKVYIGSILCALLAVTAFDLYVGKYSFCN